MFLFICFLLLALSYLAFVDAPCRISKKLFHKADKSSEEEYISDGEGEDVDDDDDDM